MQPEQGKGFRIDEQGRLLLTQLNRVRLVPFGLLCLVYALSVLAWDWTLYLTDEASWELYQQTAWYDPAVNLVLPMLIIGLLCIGLHKTVMLVPANLAIARRHGWFGVLVSDYETSSYRLDNFEHIVILPTNWLGLDIDLHGQDPRRAPPGTRFSVRLMGITELRLYRYADFEAARVLANSLSRLTGLPVTELI